MAVRSRFSPRLRSTAFEAVVVGGVFGALVTGMVMGLYRTEMTYEVGGIVGLYSLTGGWWVTVALGLVFAVPFAAVVSATINPFTSAVIGLSSRSRIVQGILNPLLTRAALAITCGGIGLGYGVAIGVVFHVVAMPFWLRFVMGIPVPAPYLTLGGFVGVVAWTLYGGSLGLIYGFVVENSTG